jgi:integrase
MRGSVRKRGSTWTWYLDVDPNPLTGRRRQQTKGGFKTRKECEAALRQAIADQRGGTLAKPSQRTIASFLVDEWLPAVKPKLRASTWASYRTNTNAHVVPVLGEVKLQGLSPMQLNLFYARLLERGRRRGGGGLSPKTVRNIHVMLHRALKDAVRWGYLPRNVADAVDPPVGRSAERHVWTPDQLGAFLEHVRADRLYALWLLVATTGMRRGELAGLRWVDIDFANARVSPQRPRVVVDYAVQVSEPKTAKGRRALALDAATLAVLREHQTRQAEEKAVIGAGYQDSGLVFTWPDGAPIHPDLITRWFEQHSRAAALPKIRLHDVRHSYASAALAAGVPAKVISERLGHATVGFTLDTYSHVLPGLDAAAAQAVAQLILRGNGMGPAQPIADPAVDKPVDNQPEGTSQERR